jgi:large subunit ribosomal protein L17
MPRNLAVRRQVGQMITDQVVLKKLVDTIAPRYFHVSSGFTRVIKIGQRRGDNAMMAKLELVPGKPDSNTDEAADKAKSSLEPVAKQPKAEVKSAAKDKKPAQKNKAKKQ